VVGKRVPASAGKAKAGMVHSISRWTRCVQVKLWDPWECVLYLSALEVCSRQGTIQIQVYLTFALKCCTPNWRWHG